MTEPIPAAVAERAATRFVKNETGCHVSTYSVGSHGYAQIGWQHGGRTQMTTAHRAAWVHFTGAQPKYTIDHRTTCDRRCVRADHLRDIPNAENGRRNGVGRDYPLGWTCRRNHGVGRDRWGKCPECTKLLQQKWRREHPERRKQAVDRYNKKRRGA